VWAFDGIMINIDKDGNELKEVYDLGEKVEEVFTLSNEESKKEEFED
jgi:hypothetical protein